MSSKKNNEAVKKIYLDYRKYCINWLLNNFSTDINTALDIFQLAVTIFYNKTIKVDFPSDNLNERNYLIGICKNLMKSHLRASKKMEPITELIELNYPQSHPDEDTEFKKRRIKKILKTIDSLNEPCKTILELFYFKGYTIEEISQVMGYKNKNTTKNMKYKCICKVKKLVFGDETTKI